MTAMQKAREAYERDATYRSLVGVMRAAIQRMQLTPSELREAAMLASVIEAERAPVPASMMSNLDEARATVLAAADLARWTETKR